MKCGLQKDKAKCMYNLFQLLKFYNQVWWGGGGVGLMGSSPLEL